MTYIFYNNIIFFQILYSVDNIFLSPLRNTPSPDEQCLRAQSLLHPVCAQTPEQGGAFDVGGPSKQVACHDIAHACSGNPECNNRLERYNQVRSFVFQVALFMVHMKDFSIEIIFFSGLLGLF